MSTAKDHAESMKALDKLSATHRQSQSGLSVFFRQAAPSTKLLEGAAHIVGAATNAELHALSPALWARYAPG